MNMDVLKKYQKVLGENDFGFLTRVYDAGFEVYVNRLKAIGFEGKGRILDAGCGFGQWSIAMAKLNEEVYGTDVSSIRLVVAKDVAESFGLNNVFFEFGALEQLPYENNYFDAIFCYSTIFIADPLKALKEFHRILKPGGSIYVNANGLGWMLNAWINAPNAASDNNPRLNVAKAFMNTFNLSMGLPKDNSQLIIEKEEMLEMLKVAGFVNVSSGDEGSININNTPDVKPFFKGSYYGFTGVYEILANKKDND